MAVKKFNPTTPSRRNMTMSTFEEITTDIPEKSLLVSLSNTGGRNAQGKITVRHHGGGAAAATNRLPVSVSRIIPGDWGKVRPGWLV